MEACRIHSWRNISKHWRSSGDVDFRRVQGYRKYGYKSIRNSLIILCRIPSDRLTPVSNRGTIVYKAAVGTVVSLLGTIVSFYVESLSQAHSTVITRGTI